MNPETPQPESQPQPQPQPSQPPPPQPIEVQAEPAAPDDRGRVFDAPPPPAGGTAGAAAGTSSGTTTSVRGPSPWPMACHVAGLLDLGLSLFGLGLIASTVVWLLKKDEDPEVDFHGKEAINFQLNQLVWMIAAVPLILACGLGLVILVAAPIVKVAFMIFAAIRAASGERWSYPLVYRVLQ